MFNATVSICQDQDNPIPYANTTNFKWYPEIFSQILCFFHTAPKLIPKQHRDNSYAVLKLILAERGQWFYDSIHDSFHFAKYVVTRNGLALEYVPNALRMNKEIVRAAVKQNRDAVKFALGKETVLAAVGQDGQCYHIINNSLQRDKQIIVAALRTYPNLFMDLSDELKDDKDVAMAAVKSSGVQLLYVSQRLKNDIDVIMAAIFQNVTARVYIGYSMRENKEVLLTLMKLDTNYLPPKIPTQLQIDEEFMNAVLQRCKSKGVTMSSYYND